MRVKLIALVLLWASPLFSQQQLKSLLPWSALSKHVYKELQQKYKDSIAYYRPKCDSARYFLHDLALSTGKDNITMFGPELDFIVEGMSKQYIQKPQLMAYRPGIPDKLVDITNADVRLFDLDVHLSHWLDAKMILDRLGKDGLVGILKLDFEGKTDEAGELNSLEAQRDWARQSIQEHMDHVLRNSPYFWAFEGDGELRYEPYLQNLQLYQDKAPTKKRGNQVVPQFQWVLPPVVDNIKEFSISSVNGDTLFKIYNGNKSGVLDKQGKIVIPFVQSFINFLPPYWIKGESRLKTFWYNRKGEAFLNEYEEVAPHKMGFAIVKKEKKWGIVDPEDKPIIPLVYEWYKMNDRGSYIFYKGMDSLIYVPAPYTPDYPNAIRKYVPPVIPQRIVDLKFDQAQEFDRGKGWYQVRKGVLQGIVDSLGQQILPIAYNEISRKGSDLIYFYKNKLGGFWIISKNIKVEPKYGYMSPVGDSSTLAIVGNDKGLGILDIEKESLLFPYTFYDIHYRKPYFLLTAQYDTTANRNSFDAFGYLHGLLNEKGEMIEKPDSVEILTYFNGSYLITPHYKEKSTRNAVLKSDKGKILRKFKRQWVTTHGPWIRYYDRTNDVKWVSYHNYKKSDVLEKTSLLTEELYTIQKAGLWGFTNIHGKEVFPPVFSEVKNSKNGLICAKINGKWGILKNPLYKGN